MGRLAARMEAFINKNTFKWEGMGGGGGQIEMGRLLEECSKSNLTVITVLEVILKGR